MDAEQFRKAGYQAIDQSPRPFNPHLILVIAYFDTIGSRPVLPSVHPGFMRQQLPTSIPLEPQEWDKIQPDIENLIMPGITHWQHPKFFSWFPCNSTYPGILGELYSSMFNCAAFNWICSPSVTELETVVLDWLAKALGLPDTFLSTGHGGGVIQGSASEAIVVVVVAARDRYLSSLTPDVADSVRGKLLVFGSDQTHSCTQKAAMIAGVKFRAIPAERDTWKLSGERVREEVLNAKREGFIPFFLTATLGTTPTCAVDDLPGIAEVCKEFPEIWLHIDAAYAGAALICPEYQYLIESVGNYDSFDMNMHKWLLTNFDVSCLYVRERKHLIDAFSLTPSYVRNAASESGLVFDYRDWQIPFGRRFRSLKVWFVMRTYGLSGMQQHIRNSISLGTLFANLIRSRSDLFEIFVEPAFALTVFTVKEDPSSDIATVSGGYPADGEITDKEIKGDLTRRVFQKIEREGKMFPSSAVVGGTFVIRVVSGLPALKESDIREAFEIVVKAVEDVKNGKE